MGLADDGERLVRRRSVDSPGWRPPGTSALAEHHVDTMFGTVVGQGYGRLAGEERSVDADLRDTAGDALRVLDADPVEGARMTVDDLEALPLPGNAGVEPESVASLVEAENRLQARTVEPASGSGVPGPPPRPT